MMAFSLIGRKGKASGSVPSPWERVRVLGVPLRKAFGSGYPLQILATLRVFHFYPSRKMRSRE